jgi:AcrR family transcriptional regulator
LSPPRSPGEAASDDEAKRGPSRDRLLDAADALLTERPWNKLSLGAIATAAGVSRQTLYNEFGSRREIAEAFVLREADRLLVAPEREITRHAHDPRAAIAAALRAFLAEAAGNHLMQAMRIEEPSDLLAMVTTRGEVIELAVGRLTMHARATWPGINPRDAEGLMNTLVRLGISHSNQPSWAPDETGRVVADVLGGRAEQLVLSVSPRAA